MEFVIYFLRDFILLSNELYCMEAVLICFLSAGDENMACKTKRLLYFIIIICCCCCFRSCISDVLRFAHIRVYMIVLNVDISFSCKPNKIQNDQHVNSFDIPVF